MGLTQTLLTLVGWRQPKALTPEETKKKTREEFDDALANSFASLANTSQTLARTMRRNPKLAATIADFPGVTSERGATILEAGAELMSSNDDNWCVSRSYELRLRLVDGAPVLQFMSRYEPGAERGPWEEFPIYRVRYGIWQHISSLLCDLRGQKTAHRFFTETKLVKVPYSD